MSVLFLLMLSLALSVDENQVCLHTLSSPICSSLSERAQERARENEEERKRSAEDIPSGKQ